MVEAQYELARCISSMVPDVDLESAWILHRMSCTPTIYLPTIFKVFRIFFQVKARRGGNRIALNARTQP